MALSLQRAVNSFKVSIKSKEDKPSTVKPLKFSRKFKDTDTPKQAKGYHYKQFKDNDKPPSVEADKTNAQAPKDSETVDAEQVSKPLSSVGLPNYTEKEKYKPLTRDDLFATAISNDIKRKYGKDEDEMDESFESLPEVQSLQEQENKNLSEDIKKALGKKGVPPLKLPPVLKKKKSNVPPQLQPPQPTVKKEKGEPPKFQPPPPKVKKEKGEPFKLQPLPQPTVKKEKGRGFGEEKQGGGGRYISPMDVVDLTKEEDGDDIEEVFIPEKPKEVIEIADADDETEETPRSKGKKRGVKKGDKRGKYVTLKSIKKKVLKLRSQPRPTKPEDQEAYDMELATLESVLLDRLKRKREDFGGSPLSSRRKTYNSPPPENPYAQFTFSPRSPNAPPPPHENPGKKSPPKAYDETVQENDFRVGQLNEELRRVILSESFNTTASTRRHVGHLLNQLGGKAETDLLIELANVYLRQAGQPLVDPDYVKDNKDHVVSELAKLYSTVKTPSPKKASPVDFGNQASEPLQEGEETEEEYKLRQYEANRLSDKKAENLNQALKSISTRLPQGRDSKGGKDVLAEQPLEIRRQLTDLLQQLKTQAHTSWINQLLMRTHYGRRDPKEISEDKQEYVDRLIVYLNPEKLGAKK